MKILDKMKGLKDVQTDEPATFRQCKALAAACNQRWFRETGVKDSLLFKKILEKAIEEKNEGKLTKNECSSLITAANAEGSEIQASLLVERIGYPNNKEADERKAFLLAEEKEDKPEKISIDKSIPIPSGAPWNTNRKKKSGSTVSIDSDVPFPEDAPGRTFANDITTDDRHAARQEKVKKACSQAGEFKDVEIKKAHAILANRLGISAEEFVSQLSKAEKDAKKIEEDLKKEAALASDRAKNIVSSASVVHGDILRVNKVLEITGIRGTGHLYRLISRNMFPAQVRLDENIFGKNSVGWIKKEVTEWVKNRPDEIHDISIDNNVPIPLQTEGNSVPKRKKPSKWPTEKLKVGESFFVPNHDNGKTRQIGIGAFRDKFPRRKVTSRAVTENSVSGTRYWRVK